MEKQTIDIIYDDYQIEFLKSLKSKYQKIMELYFLYLKKGKIDYGKIASNNLLQKYECIKIIKDLYTTYKSFRQSKLQVLTNTQKLILKAGYFLPEVYFNCSKQEYQEAINSLEKNDKDFITRYFEIDIPLTKEQYGLILNTNPNTFYSKLKRIYNLIKKNISQNKPENINNVLSIVFRATQEDLIAIKDRLTKREWFIISSIYGIGKIKLSKEKISEILKTTITNKELQKIQNKIKLILSGTPYNTDFENIEDYFNENYEDIKKAISCLNSKSQFLIKSYFGLGTKMLNKYQLAEYFKIKPDSVNKNLTKIVFVIKDIIRYGTDRIPTNLLAPHIILNCTEEELDLALKQLKPVYEYIFRAYYGLNTKSITLKEINDILNKKNIHTSVKINQIFEYLNLILTGQKDKLSDRILNIESYYNATKEKINETINNLDEYHKIIAKKYYGIDCSKSSLLDIANELGLKPNKMSEIIKETRQLIKTKLKYSEQVKQQF